MKKRVELDVAPITVALVDEGSRDFVAPEYKVTRCEAMAPPAWTASSGTRCVLMPVLPPAEAKVSVQPGRRQRS